MNTNERNERANFLGYAIQRNGYNCLTGRKHKYQTSGVDGAGRPILFHDDAEALVKWLRFVEKMRWIQDEPIHPKALAEIESK